jgi:hypothetical protein
VQGAAKEWLGGCGLNSVPSWIKPYHVLSTGERARADLARFLQRASSAPSSSPLSTSAVYAATDAPAASSAKTVAVSQVATDGVDAAVAHAVHGAFSGAGSTESAISSTGESAVSGASATESVVSAATTAEGTVSGSTTEGSKEALAEGVVFLDNFGHSLDAVTRGSCAMCAARLARKRGVCLIVASSLPDVAQWLQPDVVIELRSQDGSQQQFQQPQRKPQQFSQPPPSPSSPPPLQAFKPSHRLEQSPPSPSPSPAIRSPLYTREQGHAAVQPCCLPRLVRNANSGAPPGIRIHVATEPSQVPGYGTSSPLEGLCSMQEHGLSAVCGRVKSYAPSAEAFRCDPTDERRPHGGVSQAIAMMSTKNF